jgi:cytochrome P450
VQSVIEEAMRLYPPVGFLGRNVLKPDRLYDRDIKPNETVFPNIYALHRHRQLWDDPEAFDPGHFAPDRQTQRDKYQYLPFGAGPRICVGANFAMMQAQIILATLLARFAFRPAGPDPTPVMHMTVRPDPGIWLAVSDLPAPSESR